MNESDNIAKVARFDARPAQPRNARGLRRTVAQAFAAFTTGARLIPMGDNGRLLASLAAKSTDR